MTYIHHYTLSCIYGTNFTLYIATQFNNGPGDSHGSVWLKCQDIHTGQYE